MTDNEIKKATENDIIKALEDWLKNFEGKAVDYMKIRFALDLINRQKAEVERLQAYLEELADEVEDKMTYMCGCKNCIETVKRIIKDDVKPFDMYCDSCNRCKHREAEAVKEMIAAIKRKSSSGVMVNNGIPVAGTKYYTISEVNLYEIEKEMVGDADV